MTIRIRVIGKSDAIAILQVHEPGHGVRAGRIHAYLSVVVYCHERKRRVDGRIDYRNVQLVDTVDRLPIRKGGASQRINCETEARCPNGIYVNHATKVVDI